MEWWSGGVNVAQRHIWEVPVSTRAAPVPAAALYFIVSDCDLRQGGNQYRINISKFSPVEWELGENVSDNHHVPSRH